MKKLISYSFIATALGMVVMSPVVNASTPTGSGGTINISGAITEAGCAVDSSAQIVTLQFASADRSAMNSASVGIIEEKHFSIPIVCGSIKSIQIQMTGDLADTDVGAAHNTAYKTSVDNLGVQIVRRNGSKNISGDPSNLVSGGAYPHTVQSAGTTTYDFSAKLLRIDPSKEITVVGAYSASVGFTIHYA